MPAVGDVVELAGTEVLGATFGDQCVGGQLACMRKHNSCRMRAALWLDEDVCIVAHAVEAAWQTHCHVVGVLRPVEVGVDLRGE